NGQTLRVVPVVEPGHPEARADARLVRHRGDARRAVPRAGAAERIAAGCRRARRQGRGEAKDDEPGEGRRQGAAGQTGERVGFSPRGKPSVSSIVTTPISAATIKASCAENATASPSRAISAGPRFWRAADWSSWLTASLEPGSRSCTPKLRIAP